MLFGRRTHPRRRASSLGVDIGTHRTKAMTAGEDYGGIAISGVCSLENPVGSVIADVVETPGRLGKLLEGELAGLARFRFKPDDAVGVAGEDSFPSAPAFNRVAQGKLRLLPLKSLVVFRFE